MNYRLMKPEDIAQTAMLEQKIFSMPWSEQSFIDSLNNPDTIYFVAEEGGVIYGYCGLYILFETGELTNVAVSPEKRTQGIAGRLLKEIFTQAEKQGVTDVMLEVRESNHAAISLYKKFGFVPEGIRSDYYDMPKENALILWKHGL